MKLFKILMALFIATFSIANAIGQSNASIGVLTQNGGQVTQGGSVFIQVTVNSTGPTTGISTYRVRAQISVPSPLVSIAPNAQQTGLPANWTIVTNNGTSITVCNATDAIPVGQSRTILIRVTGGPTIGGPSPVSGTLTFGNGNAANGCTTLTGSLPGDNSADNTSSSSIQVIAAPTCELTNVSASAGTIACNGGTTTLTATQTGASGAVEYSLNGGAFQSANTFTVNAAGSPYTVTAREVATPTCVVTSSAVTVTEPASITASAAAGAIACNGGTTTLTVTASGGTGTLEYSLNSGAFQSSNTFTVNAAGSPYTVTVRDANACTATTNSVTVSQPALLTATATSTPVTTTGGSDGTATAVPAGGTPDYTYSWNTTPEQTTITATGLTAGNYTVTVTDANSCTTTASVTVSAPSCALGVTASAGTAITCNGGTTTLTATPSGAGGTVEYSITGGAPFQSSNIFTVGAGTYTVTAREAANPTCTATSTAVTITEPVALVASSTAPPIALPGGSTTVTVTATGGTPPYTGTGTFTRAAGTYTFTVTDANGCTDDTQITLVNPTPGPANAAISVLTQNSGEVTQGGTVFIEVTVNNTGPSFISTYRIRAQISVPSSLVSIPASGHQLPAGWTIVTNNGTSITVCNATDVIPANTARTILIAVQGNTVGGPSPVSGTLTFGNGNAANGCTTLTGSLTGDNSADNTSSSSIRVIPSCSIGITASAGTIACNGGTTTLTATASGASGAVEYSLNGGAFQPGNTFTAPAGTYTVTVREVATPACTATSSAVTVTEPTVLIASSTAPPISLPGGSTTVTVTASGGTAPYTGTGTFTRAAGTYTFTVTDANGCTDDTEITLVDPTPGPANAFIGVVTLNAGQVVINQTVDAQVTVGNAGPGFIGTNTVRAQINVPSAIATILPTAQQTGIPAGWSITANTGTSITVCNGTDLIPSGQQRVITIRVQGTSIGGPSPITGELTFGTGAADCAGTGSLPGDNGSDNTSSSDLQVTATLPVTLTDFNARLVNCKPALHWITQNEVEFDRFEIERSAAGSINWITVATVQARGNNNSARLDYNFTDASLNSSSDQVIYRLKLVDRDGRYKYSGILRVYINCEITQAFVYPNPVEDGRLYVSLTGAGKNSEARLVSLSGQVVVKARMSVGTNSMNVSKVAAGTYILVVTNEKGFEKKFKVFIQN